MAHKTYFNSFNDSLESLKNNESNLVNEETTDSLESGSEIESTPEPIYRSIFITKNNLKENYDTIIVGAGIAGLYAAYKIAEAKEETKILIIEQSSRTGGRLDSDLFLINSNLIKEEEGGMRFTFEDMPQLMNLFVELGLDNDIVPFPMHLDENNRRSFRGRTFSAQESERNNYKVWSDLYGLKNAEKGINPSRIIPDLVYPNIIDTEENFVPKIVLKVLEIFHKIYLDNLKDIPTIDDNFLKEKFPILKKEENSGKVTEIINLLEKYIKSKITITAPVIWQFFRLNFKWKGIELYKWTLWSLLADMGYSNECIQMMARVSGFNGTYFSTMNAGEAFQLLMEFPAEPDFKSLRYGFSQLTNALVDSLNLNLNVDVLLDTKVLKVEQVEQVEKYNCILSDLTDEQFENYVVNMLKYFSSIKGEKHESQEVIKGILNNFKVSNLKLVDDKKSKEYVGLKKDLKQLRTYYQRDKDEKSVYQVTIIIDYLKYYIIKKDNIKSVSGDSIILALPRVALEKVINASDLSQLGKPDESVLWSNLESTSNQPLAKINLYYDNAWWNSDATPNADVTFGPNFTDLPLGSVYPFYVDNEELTKCAAKLQFKKIEIFNLEEELKTLKDEDKKLKERIEGDNSKETEDEIKKVEDEIKKVEDKIKSGKSKLFKLEDNVKEQMKLTYSKPAALTIYCDYQNINFWQGFAKNLTFDQFDENGNVQKKGNAYPQRNCVRQIDVLNKEDSSASSTIEINKENITPASNEMVAAVTEYFQQLFQSNSVPKPIATSVRIWEGSQSLKTDAYGNFGYGVHQWGVGAKDDEVIESMVQPFEIKPESNNEATEKKFFPIYTCGEAYSDFQGWVEGALRSTNLVLQKGFGIVDNVEPKEVLENMRKKYNTTYNIPQDDKA